MAASWQNPSAPLTRPLGGTGQFIVRTCSFCNLRTGQGGGGMLPLHPGASVTGYACYICKPRVLAERAALAAKKAKPAPPPPPPAPKRSRKKAATPPPPPPVATVWPGLMTDARRASKAFKGSSE